MQIECVYVFVRHNFSCFLGIYFYRTLENQMFHNDVYGQLVMEELQKRREEARSAQDIDTDITPPTNM